MTNVGSVDIQFSANNLQETLNKVNELSKVLQGLENKKVNLGNISTQLGTVTQSVNTTGNAFTKMSSWLGDFSQKTGKMASTLGGLNGSIQTVLRTMNIGQNTFYQLGNEVTRLSQVAATAAYRLEMLAAPIQMITVQVAKLGIELDTQARKVATQEGVTANAARYFSDTVVASWSATAAKTGAAAKDIGEANYYIVSSMNATQEQFEQMQGAIAKFTVGGFTTAEDTALYLATAFNVYGDELAKSGDMQNQVNHALDTMLVAVRKGKADVSDFVSGWGRVAEIGKLAGASFEETQSILAGLSRVFTPSQAVTSAENFFKTLVKQSKDGAAAIEELGLKLYQVGPNGDKSMRDPLDILTDLFSLLSTKPIDVQQSFITRIFGQLRSLRGVLTLQDIQMLNDIKDWTKEMAGIQPGTEVQSWFDVVSQGYQGKINILLSTLKQIGQGFFTSQVGPILDKATTALTKFFEVVQKQPPELMGTLAKFMVGISVLPPILLALSTVGMTIGTIFTSLSIVLTPSGLATAVLGWGALHGIIEKFGGMIKDYVGPNGTFNGLVKLIADLAVQFGVLKQTNADKILESIGVSTDKINSASFKDFVTEVGNLKDKLLEVKDTVGEVFKGFEDFAKNTLSGDSETGKTIKTIIDVLNWMSGGKIKDTMGLESIRDKTYAILDGFASWIVKLTTVSILLQGIITGAKLLQIVTGAGGWLAGLVGGAGAAGAAGAVGAVGSAGGLTGILASVGLTIPGLVAIIVAAVAAYLGVKWFLNQNTGIGSDYQSSTLPNWIGSSSYRVTPPKPMTEEQKAILAGLPSAQISSSVTSDTVQAITRQNNLTLESQKIEKSSNAALWSINANLANGFTQLGATGLFVNKGWTSPVFGYGVNVNPGMITGQTKENVFQPWTSQTPPGWTGPAIPEYTYMPVSGTADTASTAASAVNSLSDMVSNIKKAFDVILGGTGGWGSAFATEHGGQSVYQAYSRYDRPMQASIIDKQWGEDFAKQNGRAPTESDWQAHWYQYWAPLASGAEGPIAAPKGAEAKTADEYLNKIINETLPAYQGKVEDLEKAWLLAHKTPDDFLDTENEDVDALAVKLNNMKMTVTVTYKDSVGNTIDPLTGKVIDEKGNSTSTGTGGKKFGELATGGYAFANTMYNLAEQGREFVLNNSITRALENKMGALTQSGVLNAITNNTGGISIGAIVLPGVTDAKSFLNQMQELANQPARIAQRADILSRLRFAS